MTAAQSIAAPVTRQPRTARQPAVRQPRKAKPAQARVLTIHARPTPTQPGAVTLAVGEARDRYTCECHAQPNGPGSCFTLTHDGDGERSYAVIIDANAGNTCTCPGFRRWSRCKHVDAMAVLASKLANVSATVEAPATEQPTPAVAPVGPPRCVPCRGTGWIRHESAVCQGKYRCGACAGSGVDDF